MAARPERRMHTHVSLVWAVSMHAAVVAAGPARWWCLHCCQHFFPAGPARGLQHALRFAYMRHATLIGPLCAIGVITLMETSLMGLWHATRLTGDTPAQALHIGVS